jgi:predicted transcriptional regulator
MTPSDTQIAARVDERLAEYEQETSLSQQERERLRAAWTVLAIQERDARAAEQAVATLKAALVEAEAKERRAREKAEERERRKAEDKERVRRWYQEQPAQRNQLKRQILKHLLSAEGRNGPDTHELSKILDYDWAHVGVCVADLKQSGGIKESEDGELYHHKVWRGLHPERRASVKHIGTVPQAVLDHKEVTAARKSVAIALSGHFYRTRRSHAKARAIGRKDLAKAASVGEATVQRAVDWLIDEKLLEVVEQGTGQRGSRYRWTAKTKLYKVKVKHHESNS